MSDDTEARAREHTLKVADRNSVVMLASSLEPDASAMLGANGRAALAGSASEIRYGATEDRGASPVDARRIEDLLEKELERFQLKHDNSLTLYERASWPLPLGVPSSVCALKPFPLAIDRGRRQRLWDIDGNRYVDYHCGFGTSVYGHGHPAIARAIAGQARLGTHYGAMTVEAHAWAAHICRRFRLDWVRFHNSGTEATMDAIRLARALTGRARVIKIEGAYHGSHEVALVSPNLSLVDLAAAGPDRRPRPRFFGEGVPERVAREVSVAPWNDLVAIQRLFAAGDVACVIVEPIMFNVGAIGPAAGYLKELRRICDAAGAKLIFDETKTAVTVAWGGAEELFGVQPHLKTLGKGIGGGIPVGALGSVTEEGYELVERYRVPLLGTFSGNPLAAVAGLTALESVLTPEAYPKLCEHGSRLAGLLADTILAYELPAYVMTVGAKGCVVWTAPPVLRDYRDYRRRFDFKLGYLAWLWLVNRGVFLAPGQDEQWTHTVWHGENDAQMFARAFRRLAAALRR